MADRLILGSGYVGQTIAQRWVSQGDRVVAVTRSTEKAESMQGRGMETLVWNWHEPLAGPETTRIVKTFPCFQTVLIAVSHAPAAGVSAEGTHVLGLQNVANSDLPIENANWIYLSTTGVYGSADVSDWVDESSPVSPTRPGSIAAWAGEEWCRKNCEPSRLVVLRPAGIYGPGRIPNWIAVRDSIPLNMDPLSHLNLIHRDDLVSVIDYFSHQNARHSLYSVADGNPPTRQQYYDYIAQLGKWPSPIFATEPSTDSITSSRKSRQTISKQVSAKRLQQEFSSYAYPNYRVGLNSVLKDVIDASE